MPWIERVEVEDGFLDGLDLQLSSGLNVVIGARGTGKTSLLELIRFVLGAPAFTEQAAALGRAQVEAILGRGRVTATIRHDDGSVESVSRTVGSHSSASIAVTVLAQNEIEAVGASARGRLHLIDRFIDNSDPEAILRLTAEVVAAGKAVDAGRHEVEALRERIEAIPAVDEELQQMREEQAGAFERASANEADRRRLEELQSGLQLTALRLQLIEQAADAVGALKDALGGARAHPVFPDWPSSAGDDPTEGARSTHLATIAELRRLEEETAGAADALVEAAAIDDAQRQEAEDESRDLRRQLGELDAEVARLSNRIAELNERMGQLRGLEEKLNERHQQTAAAVTRRDELYETLDNLREQRFREREAVADRLNEVLRKTIQIELVQSGSLDEYTNEIVSRLRGSGLHSSTLAPELAASLSPMSLVRAIEAENVDDVASLTDLSKKRVGGAFERLRTQSPSGLAGVTVDDAVDLFLVDGTSRKPSIELSIGQRCTVVLPILLQRRGDVLVIDQPEDHLDNAFVTSTLVETLRSRHSGDQIILASHNANIPVLGEADLVVHMSSDGKRGFVLHAGPLDHSDTVQAVTDVMEGGAEAFRRRADFYAEHGHGARAE